MPQSKPIPHIDGLDHFVLTVADIGDTICFYENALGMQATQFTSATGAPRHALMFGRMKINLHEKGHEFEPKALQPQPGSADLCFLTANPISAWITHLNSRDVTIEEGPVPRTGARGPLVSIYLRDPDQNLIEIAQQTV